MLSGIIASVLKWLLAALGGWLIRHAQVWWKDYQKKKADEAATQKAIDDLMNAKTKEERDAAAGEIASNV